MKEQFNGNEFSREISDWDTWSKLFQSIDAFGGLIEKIFEKEALSCNGVSHLTAGTNAVFRVGDYVAKIFAPAESGLDMERDYNCEVLGMARAKALGIPIPKIKAASYIEDKYLFRYIIMDYIAGCDANRVLKDYSYDKKIDFVRWLKGNINKLNTPIEGEFPMFDVKTWVMENSRWDILPAKVVAQVRGLIAAYEMQTRVYVHGDITGDNVLIDDDGALFIIDFADGKLAPKEYEYPPILFDLFDFDRTMIDEFIGSSDREQFIHACFYGILMHDFGAYFVKLICQRLMGIQLSELTDILSVRDALVDFLTS